MDTGSAPARRSANVAIGGGGGSGARSSSAALDMDGWNKSALVSDAVERTKDLRLIGIGIGVGAAD